MEFFNYVVNVNMGMLDRVIRVFAGIGLFGAAAFLGAATGMAGLAVLLGVLGLILIFAGLTGFCPAYRFISSWFDIDFSSKPKEISRVERMERTFRSGGSYW